MAEEIAKAAEFARSLISVDGRCPGDYSYRKASIGSSRDAFHAG
jgi:hypothetical protein